MVEKYFSSFSFLRTSRIIWAPLSRIVFHLAQKYNFYPLLFNYFSNLFSTDSSFIFSYFDILI